jgi:hypothetical protein
MSDQAMRVVLRWERTPRIAAESLLRQLAERGYTFDVIEPHEAEANRTSDGSFMLFFCLCGDWIYENVDAPVSHEPEAVLVDVLREAARLRDHGVDTGTRASRAAT